MTHPDDDVLAALALGEPAPSGVAEHAHGCPSCSGALATLRDTRTMLRAPAPVLVAPPPFVWEAVEAEINREPADHSTPAPSRAPLPAARPVPTAEPAHPASDVVGDDLAVRRAQRSGRRRFPAAWIAGAAAAGLVVGVAGTRFLAAEDTPVAPVTVASTSLDTLDTQQAKGTADVVRRDGHLDLTVSTQPIDPDGGYLEVWLINEDLTRMVSVGVLEPSLADQSFTIPQELLDQGYVIVDISREGFDEAPEHSGDSVVRGTLAT
ncbi:MAG TPA: anti-sigma factor [Ornithinibacter sp.]|nr:anti-sigma factor [Ornithinibacter sp.]